MPEITHFKSHRQYLQWYRDYRLRNLKKARAYGREYNKQYRKKHGYQNELNSKKRYPGKQRARSKVTVAIRNGTLIRGNCEVCSKKNGHAHHDNYRKPLEVRWFCPAHYSEHHRKKKNG